MIFLSRVSDPSTPTLPPDRVEPRGARTSVRTIVLVALALRLAVIFVGHTYRINPRNDFQNFGFEMGRVARSVAAGHGFSSPFDVPTGPTALVPPLYPYLLAIIFKLFGVYTRAAAMAILSLDSLFSALVCAVLYRIAERTFAADEPIAASRDEAPAAIPGTSENERRATSDEGRATRVARWTAWTWALFPYAMYWPARMVWETSLSALLMSLAILQTLRCDLDESARQWVWMGLLWGAMALTNPALLAIAPVSLIWLAVQRSLPVRHTAAAVAIAAAMIAPWTIRNYRDFHRFLLVRDNFWMELHLSNNPLSDGFWTRSEHPGNDPRAMAAFQRMGEIAYIDAMRDQVQAFILQHKVRFLGWTYKRVFFFWLGEPKEDVVGSWELDPAKHVGFGLWTAISFAGLWLMSKRQVYAAGFFAGILALYPVAYYLTRASPRYRHPIEPLLVLLTVYAVAALKRDSRPESQQPAASA